MTASLSGAVLASPLTLKFAGTVTQTTFDPLDPYAGAVVAGSPFSSQLDFSTDAVDASQSPHLGSYTLSGLPYGMANVLGTVKIPLMSTVNVSIVDGANGGTDQYSIFAFVGNAGGLGDYYSFSLLLQDDTGLAFGDDKLITGTPDIAHFSIRSFTLTGQFTNASDTIFQYEIQGNLTIPEPATAGLVGLALLGCFGPACGRRSFRRTDAA